MIKNDEYFMRIAFEEAKKAIEFGEVPIGAVIVDNTTHEIVSKAFNLKETKSDVSAHAEILAIKEASKINNNWRLDHHTIYVTLEPCFMCAGAIIQSRIERVVFSIYDSIMGGFGGKEDLTKMVPSNITIKQGPLANECKELLNSFFKNKR